MQKIFLANTLERMEVLVGILPSETLASLSWSGTVSLITAPFLPQTSQCHSSVQIFPICQLANPVIT